MANTTFLEGLSTRTYGGDGGPDCDEDLAQKYRRLVSEQRLSWTEHHRMLRTLGSGGQGVVFLSERRGIDGFTLPVAVKIFSPDRYGDRRSYEAAMGRIATTAARVAQVQHDNLLDVQNFIDRHGIRLMEMEWVDGYDLAKLLTFEMLDRAYERLSARRWTYINDVVVTRGPQQPRLKPGIAIAVLRDCLGALAALHREGIVHGDVKPSNVMLKRTGHAKIIDIGSAFEVDDPPLKQACTPTYAAPEVLEGAEATQQSDLASLGYLLIEMLSGAPVFSGIGNLAELLEAKRMLAHRLPKLLPSDVVGSEILMNLCRRLVAADPARRYPSAEVADLVEDGAADFHRQLVKGDLASEYDNEIRLWLEELE
ncbi:MAG: serine/threonine-protein kinase [Pirellulales bacterium]|nr:serine/threonine protein kinase [Planctomycetales bacterium]